MKYAPSVVEVLAHELLQLTCCLRCLRLVRLLQCALLLIIVRKRLQYTLPGAERLAWSALTFLKGENTWLCMESSVSI